jgi:PAS domain S-box-containing protein
MKQAMTYRVFRHTMGLIAAGNPLVALLESFIQTIEAENPAIRCTIHLLDAEQQHLLLGAAPSLPSAFRQSIDRLPLGVSGACCGAAAFRKARVVTQDIQIDPLWDGYKAPAQAAGLAACWSQPIVSGDSVLGALALYHPKAAVPSADDIAFIETAAELAALAIAHHRATEILEQAQDAAQKAAGAQTATSRDLTSFFDVSLDLLCIRDAGLRFVKVNKTWETILGYRASELEGRRVIDFIHPDDHRATLEQMQRIKGEEILSGNVNRYRHKDGSYRHLEWRARQVGELVFGAARDITDRLAVQAQADAAKHKAEADNRAKSEFLANMSHEIRTPLNGVIGVVDALIRTPLSDEQREMVKLIQASGVTLERLVSDILDLSKIEAGRMEIEVHPFDLQRELSGFLEMSQIRAQDKNLSFRVEYGPGARGEFHGDATRIKQVLGNLISNAVKFTTAGQVVFRTEVTAPQDPGMPSLAVFEIEDSGVGFDAVAAEGLFQRFSQADATITRRFGGSGLGLSICKALTEMMGGEITAQSEPGQGSLFRVALPLPRTRPLDDYDAAHSAADPSGDGDPLFALQGETSLRILLAEDHPTNQKVVSLILAPFGVDLTIVEDGAAAVQAFAQDRYDLVLMDMQMPVMDGLTATRELRRIEAGDRDRPRTPIIMLSANAMAEHQREALAAGADLHVSKPVTSQSLLAGIEAMLDAGGDGADGEDAAHRPH